MKLLLSPSLLVVTLSLFSIILVVNSAPVNLEVNLNPREAEADLTVCSKTIKLRDNKYASICKDPTNPRPGVVQVAGPRQYQWANSAQMSIALTKPFNLGKPTKNGYKTLIQCDHLLEIQQVKFLFESNKDASRRVCAAIESNDDLKVEFLEIINGADNLYNLDASLNNYKGKYVTSMIATAKQSIETGKSILPVLKTYRMKWAYHGLASYYRTTGAQQKKVTNDLLNFLNTNSDKGYGTWEDLPTSATPEYQIDHLTVSFTKFPLNMVKRASSSVAEWFTVNPKLLRLSLQDFAAFGTTSSQDFNKWAAEYHPSPPDEDEDTDGVDQTARVSAPPNRLDDSSVYVIGGSEAEKSGPACVRPRDSNDEAALSCTLGGGSSPSNHSGILPLSSGMNSSLSESSLSEGSLDSSSIKVLPTSTLLNTEAAQTPLNTFNRVNTLEPVNTLNRAQTFDSRPTSPTMNAILPMNPQLKPTFASTSINRFPNVVKTPVYRQSLNNGLNQNQYHSTLPFSRIPQAIPTQVSTRKFPISSNKVFSTRRLLPTTPVGSLPFRPIKNSLAFGPTVALGSVRGPSRYKLS